MTEKRSSFPKPELRVALVGQSGKMRRQHVALVPGEAVPILRLDLPDKLRGAAREGVARRQAADLLGQAAETLDVRPLTLGGSERSWDHVMVADRALLRDWHAQAGHRAKALLPDTLALPVAEGLWVFEADAGRVRARLGPADAAAGSEPVVARQLRALLRQSEPKPRAALCIGDAMPIITGTLAEASVPVVTRTSDLPSDIRELTAFSRGELALDLRRDPQAARNRIQRAVNAWRWPVLVAAIAAGLWAAAQTVVIRAAQHETRSLQSATLDMVRAELVPTGPILDVRVQVAQRLSELRAADAPAATQVQSFDVFALAARALDKPTLRVQAVSNDASGGINVLVESDDFASLDALVEALDVLPLLVEVKDARLLESTDRVSAELIVRAPEVGE